MNKTVLLILVMILGVVSGTAINASEEIPSNINWSFSVELNPSNAFTKTEIYFDGILIVTAYNDKQPVIQNDFVLKAFSFDKVPEDNSGLTVYISYFGIEEGTHKIKTKTFNQGNLTEEQEFELDSIDTVNAIKGLPESLAEELTKDTQILMKDMINKLNEDRTKLDELRNSTEQNLSEKTAALEAEIKALENALNELNTVKENELKQKELQEKEAEKFKEENKTQQNNFISGFYNFSVDHAWYGAIFLIVLLVLVALFQLYKTKTDDTIFEEALEDKGIQEEKEEKKSRFSFAQREAGFEKEKKKKFSLGDLLKR